MERYTPFPASWKYRHFISRKHVYQTFRYTSHEASVSFLFFLYLFEKNLVWQIPWGPFSCCRPLGVALALTLVHYGTSLGRWGAHKIGNIASLRTFWGAHSYRKADNFLTIPNSLHYAVFLILPSSQIVSDKFIKSWNISWGYLNSLKVLILELNDGW